MINRSSHKYTAMSKFEVLMWALSTSSFWTWCDIWWRSGVVMSSLSRSQCGHFR